MLKLDIHRQLLGQIIIPVDNFYVVCLCPQLFHNIIILNLCVLNFVLTGADDTAAMLRQEGGKAFSYKCDISNCDDVYATAKKVRAEVGKVSLCLFSNCE